MRASSFAAVLLAAAFASGAGLAQTPPPVVLVPEQAPAASGAPPAPPPTVLLPPASSEAAASDTAPARPAVPVKRPRRTAAIIQALDKTTAETLRFEAPIGAAIRYKDLIFQVHACEDSAPELGQRGAAAHLEIQSSPRPLPGRAAAPSRQLFKGWMFADAPGLHPFEHPVYDAWLLGCRGSAAPAPATAGPAPAPAPAPPKPAVSPAPKTAAPPAQ